MIKLLAELVDFGKLGYTIEDFKCRADHASISEDGTILKADITMNMILP